MNSLQRYFCVAIILAGTLLLHPLTAIAGCTAVPWDLEMSYVRGDIVTYGNS